MKNFHEWMSLRESDELAMSIDFDRIEDEGFPLEPIRSMILTYVNDTAKKLREAIPPMRAFANSLQHGYDFDLVDYVGYTARQAQELAEHLTDFWVRQLNNVGSTCELAGYIPRILNNMNVNGADDWIRYWSNLRDRFNHPEASPFYNSVIAIIEDFARNVRRITDRLRTYCERPPVKKAKNARPARPRKRR